MSCQLCDAGGCELTGKCKTGCKGGYWMDRSGDCISLLYIYVPVIMVGITLILLGLFCVYRYTKGKKQATTIADAQDISSSQDRQLEESRLSVHRPPPLEIIMPSSTKLPKKLSIDSPFAGIALSPGPSPGQTTSEKTE